MKTLMLALLGAVVVAVTIAAPLPAAAFASFNNPANIAEAANEVHSFPPMNEVQQDLNPDRISNSSAFYNGTLESLPGLHLPH